MRFAVDSNIILYAEGLNDAARQDLARRLVLGLQGLPIIVPVQVLGEALNVMIKKGKIERVKAIAMLEPWRSNYTVQATTPAILDDALELVAIHAFAIWDAIILAAASFAGAETLFSEDMQNGFIWKGTTITNPFLPYPAPIVRALLIPN
jgi:predicted nucleic acid-binding protein